MMYKNQAGKMGAMSSQPAKRKMAANVDPLERLNQKDGWAHTWEIFRRFIPRLRKKRKSIISSYGLM